MERLTRIFAETTHGTKGYEAVNEIKVDTESIHNLSEIITTLGKIEYVLEKYGIDDAKQLDNIINSIRTNTFIDIQNKEILELENANLKSELAELKQKAIVPKFERKSRVYGFAYGLIKSYVVIAYVNNSITLCEDCLSNNFEFCDNNYLVSTEEEAKQKLAEIGGKK